MEFWSHATLSKIHWGALLVFFFLFLYNINCFTSIVIHNISMILTVEVMMHCSCCAEFKFQERTAKVLDPYRVLADTQILANIKMELISGEKKFASVHALDNLK